MVTGLTGLTLKPVSFGPIQAQAFSGSCQMYYEPKTGPIPALLLEKLASVSAIKIGQSTQCLFEKSRTILKRLTV